MDSATLEKAIKTGSWQDGVGCEGGSSLHAIANSPRELVFEIGLGAQSSSAGAANPELKHVVIEPSFSSTREMGDSPLGGAKALVLQAYDQQVDRPSGERCPTLRTASLDQLVERVGVPSLCLIHADGFEYHILRGLTKALPCVTVEFKIETIQNVRLCISRLLDLGYSKFNLSWAADGPLMFDTWESAAAISDAIRRATPEQQCGAIYALTDESHFIGAAESSPDIGETVSQEPASPCLITTTLDQLEQNGVWSPGSPLRLHLGCGETLLPGYINIDYPQSEHAVMKVHPDFMADITQMNFPHGSVDQVRLHHVFEHFSRVNALAMLVKWHLWLKIGGELLIETPDLVGCAQRLLDPSSSWAVKMGIVRHLTGDQTAAWAYHIDQWFPERYTRTLSTLGFTDIRIQTTHWERPPYLANVIVAARKGVEHSGDQLIKLAEQLLAESLVAAEEKPNLDVWMAELRSKLSM